MKTKRMIGIGLIVLLIAAVFAGCSSTRTTLTAQQFQSKTEQMGYAIADATDQFEEGAAEVVLLAVKEDHQIEFFVFPSSDAAAQNYSQNMETVKQKSATLSSHKEVNMSNYDYYIRTTSDGYYVVSRIDNTMLYSAVSEEATDAAKESILALGYLDKTVSHEESEEETVPEETQAQSTADVSPAPQPDDGSASEELPEAADSYTTHTLGNIVFSVNNRHTFIESDEVTLAINIEPKYGINLNLLPITGSPTEAQYQELQKSVVSRTIEENGMYDYNTQETTVAGQSATRINGMVDYKGKAAHIDTHIFGDAQYFYMVIYVSLDPGLHQDAYTKLLDSIEFTQGGPSTQTAQSAETEGQDSETLKAQTFKDMRFLYDDQYELVLAADNQIAIRFEPGVDSVNFTAKTYAEAPTTEQQYAERLDEITTEAITLYSLYDADKQTAAIAGRSARKVTARMDVEGVAKDVEMYLFGYDQHFYAVFHIYEDPAAHGDEFESLLKSISFGG